MNTTSGRSVSLTPLATALTIAGSDPSGGAGLQADLKTFQQLGCFGMSVVTLLTVQNTQGVERVELIDEELILQQLSAVENDIPPRAIKTGALGSAANIESIASELQEGESPIVVDPVLVSKHGHRLADDDCIEAYREHLLPLATVITPNRFEAEVLVGRTLESPQDFAQAAADLKSFGPRFVLLKAGSIDGTQHHFLVTDEEVLGIELEPLDVGLKHGSGCVLSAAITAYLALRPTEEVEEHYVVDIVRGSLGNVHNAIQFGPELGLGLGPVETRVMQDERSSEA